MLNIQTKASQIANLTDARYFAAMGVHWLEFSLDQGSSGYIPPNSLLAIKEWVEGPKFIGQFGLQSADEINEAIKLFSFDAVLLPNFFPLESFDKLDDAIIIQELVIESGEKENLLQTIYDRSSKVNYFQFDFEKNGFTWSNVVDGDAPITVADLVEIKNTVPFYLLLDNLQEKDLESIYKLIPEAIICMRGGEEEKVGFKSFDELDELFEKIEELSE